MSSRLQQYFNVGNMLHHILWFFKMQQIHCPKETDYDPNVHLSYADVAVDCKSNPRMIQIHIKQSKLTHLEKV